MTATEKVINHLATCDIRRSQRNTVARALAMSQTTMARRLAAEGVQFSDLLAAEKKRRCLAILAEHKTNGKSMMDALGYNELNSFYRAFKPWFGQNYRDYKREIPCSNP